ncbi:plexin-B2-like isoform X2 [Styela clava]
MLGVADLNAGKMDIIWNKIAGISLLLLIIQPTWSSTTSAKNGYISHKFEGDSQFPLLHLTLNNRDGYVYISAVNRIYQLSKDMSTSSLNQVDTGPVNDSVQCLPYGKQCEPNQNVLKLSDNYNKLLLMDIDRGRLLVCGSIYQGICEARSLNDISKVVSDRSCSVEDCNYIFTIKDYVSCIDEDCTTFGVIAEGPTVFNPILYVATTVVNYKSSYRIEEVGAISKRSLHVDPDRENKLFLWAVHDKKSYAAIQEKNFKKYFKYGFQTDGEDGFVYFLFQKIEGQIKKTIISRVCKKDIYFYSYIEMSLKCEMGLSACRHNDELVGAFYQKKAGTTDFAVNGLEDGVLHVMYKNGTRSSLCMYTLKDLNAAFDETIIACYKYKGNRTESGGPEIATSTKQECSANYWMSEDQTLDNLIFRTDSAPKLEYYPDFSFEKGKFRCGATYLPSQITRIPEVTGIWSYHHQGVNFSALTVDLTDGGINVAFIGTQGGEIIELDINHKNNYNTINVGQPVLSDLILDDDSSLPIPHLYVMTNFSVSHMRVSVCERHTTCSQCLAAKDPYCGWCILQSKCMPKSYNCQDSWLKPFSEECIEASVPEPLERTLQGNVETKVSLLPASPQGTPNKYQCVFNDDYSSPVIVYAIDHERIHCKAPPSDRLPANILGEDYVNVTVSIRYDGTTDIVSTVATFYDCNAHGRAIDQLQPCQGCIENRWSYKCQWCISDHVCVPTGGAASCTHDSDECPQVTSVTSESRLLSVGLPTQITLNVLNLPQPEDTQYSCVVGIEGTKPVTVPASVSTSGDQVICDEETYKYSAKSSEVPANVTVYWKPDRVIDAKIFNPVSFYNCSVSYDDCSLCVKSKPEYNCGWCHSIDQCTTQQLCTSDWTTDAESCSPPQITSFFPTSGPIAGNTLVTIHGVNMGVSADEVQSVTVSSVPCAVRKDLYQISKEIVCVTGVAPKEMDGKVSITVRGITKISTESFHYRNPTLDEVLVPEGPIAGGTMVSITGSNLDAGLYREAFIGNLPCEVQLPLRSSTDLECKTSPAKGPLIKATVRVVFDGYSVELRNAFSYVKNPQILSFTTATDIMASFLAGGRDIVFSGERLNIVQDAKLVAFVSNDIQQPNSGNKRKRRKRSLKNIIRYMLNGGRNKRSTKKFQDSRVTRFSSTCEVVNSTNIICPSPGINLTNNITGTMPVETSLRLIMDNINIPLSSTLKYYPNPIVKDLDPEENQEIRNGTLLRITILNLNKDAIRESEIEIMIGERRCFVDSINDKGSIDCRIPPKPEGEETSFPVTVQMGFKSWEVGTVQYFVSPQQQGLIIGMVILSVVVTIALVVIFFCCFRRNKHYKANKNDFQEALAQLEMSVRADFRKAFAELSIDMTDLTGDIGDLGLPILGYREYATNMFFPSVRYHSCMKEPNPTDKPIPAVQQGFIQFNLLITNKHFLLSFVRTLEQQRGFSNRDKGNVASLITVVLHKKLDYFTEVMKCLVSELVATSVQRNPKLVLRRTESVAERMFSNWMAICLFPYIRDKAGKPLFLLQKAIKHQVSKGALDAVTGKARYTLSDDRLLKEDIQPETLTLFVSQSETHSDEPIIVKVLSCDTISQVKEKVMDTVYKRIPFSQRPKADQLELEWRHGRGGHLVLPSSDHANEPGSRWRRVMTIKDYKVENNATMALIIRQQKYDDVVDQYTNQSPETSVVSPMLPEDNMKVYHLVKYTDDIEQKRESTIPRDRHKHILDLYLLRLINMKGILQNYVDEVFQSILDTQSIPTAVKHFFGFLDELAKTHGIDDPEILHIWKTNSVLGRFWVTILKNPESVFDIDKPESVESSMAVIAQTFIDACSVQEHKPTKDSPINKQLYAKEIPTYKKMVQKYYSDAHEMQPVSDQDMCANMAEISRSHNIEFDVHVAYNELWGYVNKYYEEIHETLANDANTTQMVIQRLQQAYTLIDSSVNNP